jgi:hypothetical protein
MRYMVVWIELPDEYQVSNIGLVEVSDLSASTNRRLNFQTILMIWYFIRYFKHWLLDIKIEARYVFSTGFLGKWMSCLVGCCWISFSQLCATYYTNDVVFSCNYCQYQN